MVLLMPGRISGSKTANTSLQNSLKSVQVLEADALKATDPAMALLNRNMGHMVSALGTLPQSTGMFATTGLR